MQTYSFFKEEFWHNLSSFHDDSTNFKLLRGILVAIKDPIVQVCGADHEEMPTSQNPCKTKYIK